MIAHCRIRERVIEAALITLLFLASGVYSCFGQSQDVSIMRDLYSQEKNADHKIHLASKLNLEAKAVPLNASINSAYDELKPAVAPHGVRLYFSRPNYPGNVGGEADYEDIWYTEFDSTASVWSEPIRLPGVLNNEGPNFVCGISATGDTLILGNQYTKKGKMREGLSYSVNKDGTWSDPTPIHIKNAYNISDHGNFNVSLSTGVIISAVQRDESYGDRDLYVSFWNGKVATEPINMGNVINTELEESSPYLAADRKSLYFASKGHHGYGGYDIYVSRRLDDSWTNWTVPENLGPAVNGPMDDEFFVISHCKRFAFFSKQISVNNIDLFRIPMAELFTEPTSCPIEPQLAGTPEKKENNKPVVDKTKKRSSLTLL